MGKSLAAGADGGYDDSGAAVGARCSVEEGSDERTGVYEDDWGYLLQACRPCWASCSSRCLHGCCVPAGAVPW